MATSEVSWSENEGGVGSAMGVARVPLKGRAYPLVKVREGSEVLLYPAGTAQGAATCSLHVSGTCPWVLARARVHRGAGTGRGEETVGTQEAPARAVRQAVAPAGTCAPALRSHSLPRVVRGLERASHPLGCRPSAVCAVEDSAC